MKIKIGFIKMAIDRLMGRAWIPIKITPHISTSRTYGVYLPQKRILHDVWLTKKEAKKECRLLNDIDFEGGRHAGK